jgi:hypothetical protein
MYMFKARLAAAEELRKTYEELNLTEEEVRGFLAKNPKYASPFHHAPHTVAGSAANLLHEIAPLIKLSRVERAKLSAKRTVTSVVDLAKSVPSRVASVKAALTDPETHARLGEDYSLIKDLITGKAKDRFGPLVAKLAGKAYFENNPEVSHVVVEDQMAIAAEEE